MTNLERAKTACSNVLKGLADVTHRENDRILEGCDDVTVVTANSQEHTGGDTEWE